MRGAGNRNIYTFEHDRVYDDDPKGKQLRKIIRKAKKRVAKWPEWAKRAMVSGKYSNGKQQ